MMAVAPASASISAEISPVWAPEALGWQSCAPTATFACRAPCRRRRRSASPADRPAGRPWRPPLPRPRAWRRIRPSEALQAVHFPVAGDQRPDGVGHVEFQQNEVRACASRASRPVPDDRSSALNRSRSRAAPPRLRRESRHFMMTDQFGDALLRNSHSRRAPVPLLPNKLDPCFEECAKPHQTGSARPSWPS